MHSINHRAFAANDFSYENDEDTSPLLSVDVENDGDQREVSLPFNVTSGMIKRNRYESIKEGLKIVRHTQDAIPCRRTFLERTREITLLWSCKNPAAVLCLLCIPSVLLGGLLAHHFYVQRERNLEIESLRAIFSPATEEWNAFMHNYTGQLNALQQQLHVTRDEVLKVCSDKEGFTRNWIESCTDFKEFQQNNYAWSLFHKKWPKVEVDYDHMTYATKWHLRYTALEILTCTDRLPRCNNEGVCSFAREMLACFSSLSQHNLAIQSAIESFISQQANQKTLLEAPILDLQAQIDSSEKSSWSPILAVCLIASFLLSVSYLLYLYIDKKRAARDFENHPQLVHKELKVVHLPQIINLASEFKLNPDVSLEELKTSLELIELQEAKTESLFLLFSLLKLNQFPRELIEIIVNAMRILQNRYIAS